MMDPEEAVRTANELMSKVDIDNNGYINYSEFVMASADMNKYMDKGKLKDCFNFFDKGNKIKN